MLPRLRDVGSWVHIRPLSTLVVETVYWRLWLSVGFHIHKESFMRDHMLLFRFGSVLIRVENTPGVLVR